MITIEEFAVRAKELRSNVDAAEREFLNYLVWGESQTFWQETGYTYLELLKHLSIVEPARYDAYKKMTAQHGAAADVSVNALREAARFQTREAQREVLDQATQWEKTNETPISPQSAEKIARDVRSRMAAITTRNKGYASVVAELETARRDVERLTNENRNLRAELSALKVRYKVSKAPKAKRTRRAA